MNLALFATLFRILLSPLFPLIYLGHDWMGLSLFWAAWLLLILLTICESSDLFDGFWARRKNQVTDLGKILDPMADSVTHISLFLSLTYGPVQLPLLLVLIFLYRDFFISTLRTLCALKGVALAARFSGKMKTAIQGVVSFFILALLIPYDLGMLSLNMLQWLSLGAVALSALYTLLSAGDYVFANRFFIRKALK
jgi:CDP-diacylglycerol--glycerol-3-phosphate 3-phosphatidyltransferase